MRTLAALLILAFAVPARAEVLAEPMAAAGKLVMEARHFAEDRALAALYERLFALQDLKRAAELKIAKAELSIDYHAKAYKRLDRYMNKELLKEIAVDPDHRRYPRLSESSKLRIVEAVAELIYAQELAGIEVEMIELDISEVKRMIEEHLQARGK